MKFRAIFFALILSLVFSSSLFAVDILEDGLEKGQISEINCTDGLDCDPEGNRLIIQAIQVHTRATFSLMSPAAKVGSAVLITNSDSATNCGSTGTGSVVAVCIKGATGTDTTWTALTS